MVWLEKCTHHHHPPLTTGNWRHEDAELSSENLCGQEVAADESKKGHEDAENRIVAPLKKTGSPQWSWVLLWREKARQATQEEFYE